MSVVVNIQGAPADILQQSFDVAPELVNILLKAREIRHNKAVEEYQAAVLYVLAKRYCRDGCHALEIGSARGYSGSVIARAVAPHFFMTVTPDPNDFEMATRNLSPFGHVRVGQYRSVDLLTPGLKLPEWDFIFVDGDHKNVRLDLPFFNQLKTDGMIIFHDYAPDTSYRPCPPVYEGLNKMRNELERDFDVRVIDEGGVGMVGFVRREGEVWSPAKRESETLINFPVVKTDLGLGDAGVSFGTFDDLGKSSS